MIACFIDIFWDKTCAFQDIYKLCIGMPKSWMDFNHIMFIQLFINLVINLVLSSFKPQRRSKFTFQIINWYSYHRMSLICIAIAWILNDIFIIRIEIYKKYSWHIQISLDDVTPICYIWIHSSYFQWYSN